MCEGGDLFGEGHVDGLRAIYDRETPLDPANPEYGAKVNQFLFTDASSASRAHAAGFQRGRASGPSASSSLSAGSGNEWVPVTRPATWRWRWA